MSSEESPDKPDHATDGNPEPHRSGAIPPSLPPSNSHKQEKKGFCEKWKHELEFLAVLAAVIYCVINFFEWRTFDSERNTMEKEFLAAQSNASAELKILQQQITETKRQTDNMESQQRALLQFEPVTTSIFTNYVANNTLTQYTLTLFMPVKNVGQTPAVDLYMTGVGFPENDMTRRWEELDRKNGITNTDVLRRFDRKNVPTPSPFNGDPFMGGTTRTIQPQEIVTNGMLTMGTFDERGIYYIERWLSYRDIFNHPWVVGEGGYYDFTNNVFVLEFLYSQKYHPEDKTNSASVKK